MTFFKADEDLKLCHITVIGPSKKGAQLEGSKEFCKTVHDAKTQYPNCKISRYLPKDNLGEGYAIS